MTLQEIQYKAQAIMQKWRDEDSAPYIEFVEELALMDVPELPDGLEEAVEESWAEYEYRETPQGLYSSCYKDGFIAGAEWQEKQTPLPEDTTIFLKGVAEGKRLMMEEAVEGVAEELYNDGIIHCTIGVGVCFQPGEKVYVIKKDGKC